jgi:hypothetical protein
MSELYDDRLFKMRVLGALEPVVARQLNSPEQWQIIAPRSLDLGDITPMEMSPAEKAAFEGALYERLEVDSNNAVRNYRASTMVAPGHFLRLPVMVFRTAFEEIYLHRTLYPDGDVGFATGPNKDLHEG